MIFSGQEIQALLGSMMIHEHVPFVDSVKPVLTVTERECIDTATDRLRAARRTITPSLPRETPGWLALMHSAEADVHFIPDEIQVLAKVSRACLSELRNDGDLSAHVAGVGLSALRSVSARCDRKVYLTAAASS